MIKRIPGFASRRERGFPLVPVFTLVTIFSPLGLASTRAAVTMTAPADKSTVSGTVSVTAKTNGQLGLMKVYVDGSNVASTSSSSFAWSSNAVPDGNHTISISTFDANGQPAGAAAAAVVVSNAGPVVAISSPPAGSSVSGNVEVDVQAASNVEWVNLYIDGTYLASSPPYDFTWNSEAASNGSHRISVKAFDSNDRLLGRSSVRVIVANSGSATTPAASASPAATPTPSAPSAGSPAGSTPSYLATLGTLPPGASLPSDSDCASMISYSSWEPRPDNASYNQTTPPASWLQDYDAEVAGGEGGAPGSYLQRVDGQFTGTTDEIIQWAACKWGFDANVVRAIAVNESYWEQSHVGDNGDSYGIVQIKTTAGNYPSTIPYAQDSTAFNLDYKLAQQRACFEGQISYLDSSSYPNLSNVDYMLWGCVGQWYSGHWYDSGAQSYIQETQGYLNDQTWAQPGF